MRRSPPKVADVAKVLSARYKDFSHFNRYDPYEELVYIFISTMTQQAVYLRVFSDFIKLFPDYPSVSKAPVSKLRSALTSAGLARRKASLLRELAQELDRRLGGRGLESLDSLSDKELEAFFVSLPGVGKKVARCVMMYSYDRAVFPVDTHCWRVARRLGWVRPTRKDGACAPKDMDRLQGKIPLEVRYSLHVNMVSLGRDVCHVRTPECNRCILEACCPKIAALQLPSRRLVL